MKLEVVAECCPVFTPVLKSLELEVAVHFPWHFVGQSVASFERTQQNHPALGHVPDAELDQGVGD